MHKAIVTMQDVEMTISMTHTKVELLGVLFDNHINGTDVSNDYLIKVEKITGFHSLRDNMFVSETIDNLRLQLEMLNSLKDDIRGEQYGRRM